MIIILTVILQWLVACVRGSSQISVISPQLNSAARSSNAVGLRSLAGDPLNPSKLLVAQVVQTVNHQIGVCIDAVVGFPCIRIVAGLNGLIDPFAIAEA